MKFMMSYSWTPTPAPRRRSGPFCRSGGVPPHGIRLLGRWTAADLGSGFALVETEGRAGWRNSPTNGAT